jgi:ankyrin repeat domain-containing protein 13
MEISFHFKSSVNPFIGRIEPSDTYRIWKHGAALQADMTRAGFDGFRIQHLDQTFLFLGDGARPKGNLEARWASKMSSVSPSSYTLER